MTKFTNYDLIIITNCEEKKYFRSSLTEISRLVRGERKSLNEYIPEFHTESFLQVGCDGRLPLTSQGIEVLYLSETDIICELRW